MIQVKVKTATIRQTVNAELNQPVKSVLDELGIETDDISVNLNGEILSAADLRSTFQTFEIQDGETVRLTCVTKLDGGAN